MAEPFPRGGQQLVHTRGHPASLALGEEVAGPIGSRACENPGVDLTAVATPGYFGSMGLENWLLKRRAERIGPTAADYERGDTLANLAMGTASLFIPMATHAVADKIAPQRSKTGKGILAVAATAAVATTVADRIVRRHRQGAAPAAPPETVADDPVVERARLVARYGGPTAGVAGAVALTSAVGVVLWRSWFRSGQFSNGGWAATYASLVSVAPAAVLAYDGSWWSIIGGAFLGAVLAPPIARAISARLPDGFHPVIGNTASMAISTAVTLPILGLLPH